VWSIRQTHCEGTGTVRVCGHCLYYKCPEVKKGAVVNFHSSFLLHSHTMAHATLFFLYNTFWYANQRIYKIAEANEWYTLYTSYMCYKLLITLSTSVILGRATINNFIWNAGSYKACPHCCVQSGLNRFRRVCTDHRIWIKPVPCKPPRVVVSNQFTLTWRHYHTRQC